MYKENTVNLLDNVGPHFVYKYPAYPVEGSISKLVVYVSLILTQLANTWPVFPLFLQEVIND